MSCPARLKPSRHRAQNRRLVGTTSCAPSKQAANRTTHRLQAVQVLRTNSRGPGPHFVLRESEPRVRIVVANAVQRRLSFVIRNPEEEGSAVAWHQGSRSNQQPLLL